MPSRLANNYRRAIQRRDCRRLLFAYLPKYPRTYLRSYTYHYYYHTTTTLLPLPLPLPRTEGGWHPHERTSPNLTTLTLTLTLAHTLTLTLTLTRCAPKVAGISTRGAPGAGRGRCSVAETWGDIGRYREIQADEVWRSSVAAAGAAWPRPH